MSNNKIIFAGLGLGNENTLFKNDDGSWVKYECYVLIDLWTWTCQKYLNSIIILHNINVGALII